MIEKPHFLLNSRHYARFNHIDIFSFYYFSERKFAVDKNTRPDKSNVNGE